MLESRLVSILRGAAALSRQVRGYSRISNGGKSLRPTFESAAASEASAAPLARWGSFYGFRSLSKGFFGQPSRSMSSSASLATFGKAEVANKGLKLLITEGAAAQKKVGIWLFGCAAWVFSMVVLGGITRLTRSGLSMTDWKFTGSLPPLSEEQWQLEFQKYQQSPEYKRINKGMSMEDFKFIYWMEYAHRMWGRGLGIVFALPFAYFFAKGFITRHLGLRLSALFALGAGQGFVGWWMVKSGLEEPPSEYVQPRVSPYRLAAHLTSAFVIYCGLLWTALSVVMPEPPAGTINWVHGAAKVQKLVLPICAIVGITAVSGAFVAGNDAGHAYNTFPKMGDTWIPDDVLSMEPLFRNFFENTSTVQLNHRILATTSLISIGGLWLATRKIDMHPAINSLIRSTLGMAALQVTLGITTLLTYVPASLGSAHQAGALTLFSLIILLAHVVRKPSPTLLKSLASLPKSSS
ncbi:unnamed protein product [Spirodela intermedia]|uniref:Uncharacterized protein n=1 Tax=Spirodela intermedia TaxID=51605 RepID=A0A7I8IU90_SPIIN|nr:unnamed protein product [Spirodela intermedia]CAA6661556.1 unnamed protein product [Spirodela intermedia]